MFWLRRSSLRRTRTFPLAIALALSGWTVPAAAASSPSPMIDQEHRAKWVFAYKFNAASFPTTATLASCMFGGTPKTYPSSQHYVLADFAHSSLRDGPELIGTSTLDPVGATFAKIYAAGLNFVVWNDQFYRHPQISGCGESCGGPWGHSKGVVAWDGH